MDLEAQNLAQVLAAARDQVATALWLSAGMLCAIAAVACQAAGLRRTGLGCGLLYSATLCFVHNGHAQILGPLGCAIAAVGLAWPARNRTR